MDDYLLQVRKPARYIGGEWNVPKKDFAGADIRCALCFPDMYEIGMSNLGLRILYGILNTIPGVSCERCFSYADDMEQMTRARAEPLSSLETHTPLGAFGIVGFSVGSELCYTNILRMLSLAGIPLESEQRTAQHPIVIAGGPCVLNPEPLHAFIDAFLIGEWEEGISDFIAVYRRHHRAYKSGALSRVEFLRLLSGVEGVYVPSLYEVSYHPDGSLACFEPRFPGVPAAVRKRYVRDLDAAFFPVDWLVPYIQVVHDRISVEVMRGCPNRCRFCQARSQYYPLRLRDPQKVFSLVTDAYRKSGYEEVALSGLSVSDYPHLEPLVCELIGYFKDQAVGVSLPSLKANRMVTGGLFDRIARIKKTGLTFAPEAGTARLRELLNKDFDEAVFCEALTRAYQAGYKQVKLYFMIGLPSEEETDLRGIIELTRRVSSLRRQALAGNSPAQVNVSINTFIPKPHTPFQWFGMEEQQVIRQKQELLARGLKDRKTAVSFQPYPQSFLEAVLARGDRRISAVILRAFRKGARFDAWDEHFDHARWMEAFGESAIDPEAYLRPRTPDAGLPWDFIDSGVTKEFLREDFKKTIAITQDR